MSKYESQHGPDANNGLLKQSVEKARSTLLGSTFADDYDLSRNDIENLVALFSRYVEGREFDYRTPVNTKDLKRQMVVFQRAFHSSDIRGMDKARATLNKSQACGQWLLAQVYGSNVLSPQHADDLLSGAAVATSMQQQVGLCQTTNGQVTLKQGRTPDHCYRTFVLHLCRLWKAVVRRNAILSGKANLQNREVNAEVYAVVAESLEVLTGVRPTVKVLRNLVPVEGW
ncbi:MAG: hypothetical protein HXX19_11340 [Rhodoferax sp.]|nr:hypothetical protein [Rhodoferax sp.]